MFILVRYHPCSSESDLAERSLHRYQFTGDQTRALEGGYHWGLVKDALISQMHLGFRVNLGGCTLIHHMVIYLHDHHWMEEHFLNSVWISYYRVHKLNFIIELSFIVIHIYMYIFFFNKKDKLIKYHNGIWCTCTPCAKDACGLQDSLSRTKLLYSHHEWLHYYCS